MSYLRQAILLSLFVVLVSIKGYTQEIDLSTCYTMDAIEDREACAGNIIFDALITHLNNDTNQKALDSIDVFVADFELYHKDGEQIHLIQFRSDKGGIMPIVSDFFKMQQPISDLIKDYDKTQEISWGGAFKFQKNNGQFTAKPIDKVTLERALQVYDTYARFPGCKQKSNEALKKCFHEKVNNYVMRNFNKKMAGGLGLQGRQRISTRFKVNKEGDIVDIKVRAPHPKLEKEAIRVLKLLPKIEPATYEGTPVESLFALPILFTVQ